MIFGKHINKYYLKCLPMFIFGIVALILVDYCQLEIPALYRTVINGINNGVVEHNGAYVPFDMAFLLESVCKPMIVIVILMVFGRFLWRVCFFNSSVYVETKLRLEMFDNAKGLSQEYYQTNKIGTLMSLFTHDLETVQDCFGWGVMMFCDAVFLGILAIYKMVGMDYRLTLLAMIPSVLLLVVSGIIGHFMEKKWDEREASFSKLSDFAQETFTGLAVVKAFVKEVIELRRFAKLNKDNEKVNVEFTRIETVLSVFISLCIGSVISVILGYGGYLVYKGEFTGGQLVEFIGYFQAVVWPIMAISQLIDMGSRGKASLKRIGKLLDARPDVVDRDNTEDVGALNGNISFKNLTFRYPESQIDVLKNVSFDINAGEKVGIIGKTGSGKTTIVDLLIRTYNVPDGTVFCDGHDVNSISIKSLRDNIAYVPQDNFLFSDTIANNISFASDGIGEDQIETAAKNADVHNNIIEFAQSYSTVLGERGVTVSGGQKQRISIARALMKDAPILILDDSVSAVDVDTEKKILANLVEVREGKTTILIAHRVSTIENMDKIIFVDDGEILAVGSHRELYSSCPEYKQTVDLQKLDEEVNGKESDGNV